VLRLVPPFQAAPVWIHAVPHAVDALAPAPLVVAYVYDPTMPRLQCE
jgi:hypothetical protein